MTVLFPDTFTIAKNALDLFQTLQKYIFLIGAAVLQKNCDFGQISVLRMFTAFCQQAVYGYIQRICYQNQFFKTQAFFAALDTGNGCR